MRLWLAVLLLPAALAQSPSVARGDKLFAQGCSVGYCHGAGGSAARSPRLRGRTFDRDYLIRVIKNGIPNTAMPAWGDRLTDADIDSLTDYIQSLANASIDVAAGPAPADAGTPPTADKPLDIPEEHRHGRELFFDLTRERRCAACHRLDGFGTAIGPDITKVAAIKTTDGPRVLKYGRPRNVRTLVLADGDRFPGIVAERSASETRVHDLTVIPPVIRYILNTDIQTILRQSNWRHGNVVRGYSDEELQSIWNYARYVAARK